MNPIDNYSKKLFGPHGRGAIDRRLLLQLHVAAAATHGSRAVENSVVP